MALEPGTPVRSSEGDDLGQVSVVVADDQKDIFSGLAFRPGVLGPQRFAPANAISEITPQHVTLRLSSAEAEALEEYEG